MASRDVSLPRDSNHQVIRALGIGILRTPRTVAIGAGATQLNADPALGATVLIIYSPIGNPDLIICDRTGAMVQEVTAGTPFIVDAVGDAQKTFYARNAMNVQVTELG